jgi:hypothetical protein
MIYLVDAAISVKKYQIKNEQTKEKRPSCMYKVLLPGFSDQTFYLGNPYFPRLRLSVET